MTSQTYTLVVQNQLEERQIRRLGAAVTLIWKDLAPEVREQLIAQASAVHISGETVGAEDLREQILSFLEIDSIRSPR
jgi:hypothetical protein